MDINNKKRILIITNHYLENKAGGTYASLSYISAFASLFDDCFLIYPDKGTKVSHLLNPGIKTIPVKDDRPGWLKGIGIYFGKLHRFGKVASAGFLSLKPDIVVFDTSIVSYRLIKLAKTLGIFSITIHHNVEYDYSRDNPYHIAYRFAYNFYVVRAERDAVRNSDLNLTLTGPDKARLAELYTPDKIHMIKTSGVFDSFKHFPENVYNLSQESSSGKYKFIISGNLSFPQSDVSIRRFIKNFWPIIRSSFSFSELVIAGRNPSMKLKHLSRNFTDIRLVPNPENINEVIGGGNFYLCPVDKGSGFKFRIMDGLKHGMPVIAHEISARGYDPVIENGNMLVYNSEESFEKAVNKLAHHKFDRNEIQKEFEELFSFEHGKLQLKSILEEITII